MKKSLIILIGMFLSIACIGQSGIKISYQYASDEMGQLYNLLGINYLGVNVAGDFSGKKITVFENKVENGEIKTKVLYKEIASDTIFTMKVMAQSVAEDSLKMNIDFDNRYINVYRYSVRESCMHSVMNLNVENLPAINIPFFAYTTGLKGKRIIGGETVDLVDFCALRDAKVSPELWTERFGFTDYIFYTIDIE